MSVDQAIREIIRAEISQQLAPLREVVSRLEAESGNLELLGRLAEQLVPFAQLLGLPMPAPRTVATPRGRPARAGRPAQVGVGSTVIPGGARRGRPGRPPRAPGRLCAIIGCGNPARSKGYCSAHYQKLRMLIRTNRRPDAWIDDAAQSSVPDVVLPRGRAASKALQAGNGNHG